MGTEPREVPEPFRAAESVLTDLPLHICQQISGTKYLCCQCSNIYLFLFTSPVFHSALLLLFCQLLNLNFMTEFSSGKYRNSEINPTWGFYSLILVKIFQVMPMRVGESPTCDFWSTAQVRGYGASQALRSRDPSRGGRGFKCQTCQYSGFL